MEQQCLALVARVIRVRPSPGMAKQDHRDGDQAKITPCKWRLVLRSAGSWLGHQGVPVSHSCTLLALSSWQLDLFLNNLIIEKSNWCVLLSVSQCILMEIVTGSIRRNSLCQGRVLCHLRIAYNHEDWRERSDREWNNSVTSCTKGAWCFSR